MFREKILLDQFDQRGGLQIIWIKRRRSSELDHYRTNFARRLKKELLKVQDIFCKRTPASICWSCFMGLQQDFAPSPWAAVSFKVRETHDIFIIPRDSSNLDWLYQCARKDPKNKQTTQKNWIKSLQCWYDIRIYKSPVNYHPPWQFKWTGYSESTSKVMKDLWGPSLIIPHDSSNLDWPSQCIQKQHRTILN